VLDIRDGGWWAPAGWLVGAAWLLALCLAPARAARALARAASVLAVLAWACWPGAAGVAARMPPLPLVELDGASRPATWRKPPAASPWSSTCGPPGARLVAPRCRCWQAAQQRETAVAFVFVNQGEGAETVQRYLARERLPLRHVLLDPAQALGPAVGSRGLPTTLFYDAQGRQVDAHFGILNAAALESRLAVVAQPHLDREPPMTHDLPRIDNELEVLADLVPLDGQHIIELGCGAARLLRDLLLAHPTSQGLALEVDERQHAKNLAQPQHRLTFAAGGAQAIAQPMPASIWR
jgi:hypothetical protein